MSQLQKATG